LGHCEAKTGDSLSRHDRAVGRATERRKLNEEQAFAKEEKDKQEEKRGREKDSGTKGSRER